MFYGASMPTIFKALVSTSDGRIKAGNIYTGNFFWVEKSPIGAPKGWRVKVVDEKNEIMTFDPDIFGPSDL